MGVSLWKDSLFLVVGEVGHRMDVLHVGVIASRYLCLLEVVGFLASPIAVGLDAFFALRRS